MTQDIKDLPLYGEYNWSDPIYKIIRRETASPRFKIYMMQQGMLNLLFYQFTDMKALRMRAGIDLDGLMRKQRRLLIEERIVTDANEKMKRNYSQNGHAYEDLEEADYTYGDVWCG